MNTIDTTSALSAWLLDHDLAAQDEPLRISFLDGGVSCTAALIETGKRLLLFKQALPRLKVKGDWYCDPSRMRVEMEANAVWHSIVPESVPDVMYYDPEDHIFIREAAPASCVMWKTHLLAGRLDFGVATAAMRSLALVHTACADDAALCQRFADKQFFYDLRIQPYLECVAKAHPQVAESCSAIVQALMEASVTLVHGDFSPKNILVDEQRIWVLDYEVAHYGHPAFDLAFFFNHFLLKVVKNPERTGALGNLMRNMSATYSSTVQGLDKKEIMADTLALLPLLLLARVDGKSPAEYLTTEAERDRARRLALAAYSLKPATLEAFVGLAEHWLASQYIQCTPCAR